MTLPPTPPRSSDAEEAGRAGARGAAPERSVAKVKRKAKTLIRDAVIEMGSDQITRARGSYSSEMTKRRTEREGAVRDTWQKSQAKDSLSGLPGDVHAPLLQDCEGHRSICSLLMPRLH